MARSTARRSTEVIGSGRPSGILASTSCPCDHQGSVSLSSETSAIQFRMSIDFGGSLPA